MRTTTAMSLVLCMGYGVHSQVVSLRGTVKCEAGSAISGATVALESKQLKAITSANGAYTLASDITGVQHRSLGPQAITFRQGFVEAYLTTPSAVQIDWMDVSGSSLGRVSLNAPSGPFTYETAVPLSASLSLLRVTIGPSSATFRVIRSGSSDRPNTYLSVSSTVSSRSLASVDSLKVSATGYTTKIVPLSTYEGTVDITLASSAVACNPADKLPDPVKVNVNVGGAPQTGAYKVVVETDPTLPGRTIYRPSELAPGKKYPILVWGNGACSKNGTDHADFWGEVASHGYIVINEGSPGGSGSYDMGAGMGVLGGYLIKNFEWAIQQNDKSCSRFYQSLDTAKIGAFGYSCGGLMAYGASLDAPRVKASIIMNSGMLNRDIAAINRLHAPIAYVCGGTGDMAYVNGERDFNDLGHLPTVFANVTNAGHGGTYANDNGGEFGKFAVAWFNWWLKDDTGATGRLKFVGDTRAFNSGTWSPMQAKKLP